MSRTRLKIAVLFALPMLLSAPVGRAADADVLRVSAEIDRLIAVGHAERGVQPVGPAADEEFLRRVYLDLAGRIPTRGELTAFCASPDPGKRAAAIDSLLAGEEHTLHLANNLNSLLQGQTAFPLSAPWQTYLRTSVAQAKGWDRMTREMLLARPPVVQPPSGQPTDDLAGAEEFLARRLAVSSLDLVTRDVTRLLFGVDMQCARCHTHPVVSEWLPESYWGMAAFFNRTYVVQVGGRAQLAERSRGDVSYTTAEKQTFMALPRFMTGAAPAVQPPAAPEDPRSVDRRAAAFPDAQPGDPRLDNPEEYALPPAADAAAVPLYSRRQAFVELAVNSDNPYFARSMVNRVWSWLMGRGLVEPLDQLHLANTASHEELLKMMTAEFVAGGFDLKRLVRSIVYSRTYQMTSAWPVESLGPRPPQAAYAVAAIRPLPPYVYATAMLCSVGALDSAGDRGTFETQQAERLTHYLKVVDPKSEMFQPSAQLALYLANSEEFDKLIAEGGLAARLVDLPDEAVVQAAFECVLSRPPSVEEREQGIAYLSQRADRRPDACRQLVWSLVNASEFRFNH